MNNGAHIAKDVYVAMHTIAPAPVEIGSGFVATAIGRTFHEGMFGMGETPDEARKSLAKVIRDALVGAAGAQRGFELGRFTRIMLTTAEVFDLTKLGDEDAPASE